MRTPILVVARDVALRARLARMLSSGGYRAEIAESVAHARRIELKGITLAIIAAEGLSLERTGLSDELASVGAKILLVVEQASRQVSDADVIDASDETALLGRVAEVLRPVVAADAAPPVLRFAGYSLDLGGHSLWDASGTEVPLTRGELGLLREFVERPGRVLSRDHLLKTLVGRDAEAFDRSIDMLIVRLRRKIEPDPKRPSLIVTVPGSGYKFAARVHKAEAIPSPELEPGKVAAGTTPLVPERRQVTAVSADLIAAEGGSSPKDPEELCSVIDAYRRYVAAVITRHGGTVAGCHVREALAYFGYPVAQEHAAERAIYAALSLAEHLAEGDAAVPPGFGIRVGVASGLVLVNPAGEVLGETPTEAVRLHELAEPGQVIIAASTWRLAGRLFVCQELGPLNVKGAVAPIHAWHVLGPSALASQSEAVHTDVPTPLVGREEELNVLLRRWQHAKSGEGCLVLLSGEPGIGKSRLLAALQQELAIDPHASLQYFCSPLHQDSAFHPVIARWEQEAGFRRGESAEQRLCKLEAILAAADLPPEDVALIAAMLSIPTGARYPQPNLSLQRRKERTFAALNRRLAGVARTQPVLMLFEDAQWADPSSLDLLDTLLQQLPTLPILLVISFRPEFAAPWIGRPGTSLIALSRLSRRQSAMLAAQVTTERALTPALLARIVTQADGVPLFIEELTKAIVETANNPGEFVPPLAVPATLQASLMARFERLPMAKHVAQIGAVIGREFSYPLLAAVASLPEALLAQGLDDLVASALVFRRGMPPDAVYTFKHALVQDVAYDSLLRSRLAEIHTAIVVAAEGDTSLAIEPGILGHHCAQAGLIAKAAFYYRLAGEQSAKRAASVENRVQLERGLQFASTLPDGPDRYRLEVELLLALADILQLTKGMADIESGAAFERAIQVARRLGSPQVLGRALVGRLIAVSFQGELASARPIAEELLELSKACDDAQVTVLARTGMGITLFWQGSFVGARRHLEILAARLAREPEVTKKVWRETAVGPAFLTLTLACLGYPERAASEIKCAIAHADQRETYSLAMGLSVLGRALIVLQDDLTLRERMTTQITLSEEHGYFHMLATSRCALGWLQAREGRVQEGLDMLCSGLAGLRDSGTLLCLPFYRGLEADALACGGRRSEALRALEDALEVSRCTGESWFDSELHRWRGELLLSGAAPQRCAAERELQQAVEIARDQSAKLFELRAATRLARVWAAQGNSAEARDLLASIYGWFTEGFDTLDMKQARSLLKELR
jgi:DNA-binding response OmpR family regulator/class 3 adenylate cyclase/tetratricopeptide (TPR) repeat protein